ncbi:MAG: hypothetical protein U0531_14400 [Dehalococcoidia bacterium]
MRSAALACAAALGAWDMRGRPAVWHTDRRDGRRRAWVKPALAPSALERAL